MHLLLSFYLFNLTLQLKKITNRADRKFWRTKQLAVFVDNLLLSVCGENSVEETIEKRQIQYISLRAVLDDKNMRFSGILERGW